MNEAHIALLREAYAKDVIDFETMERFVELVVEEKPVALPIEVLAFGPQPQHTRTASAILKEAWGG